LGIRQEVGRVKQVPAQQTAVRIRAAQQALAMRQDLAEQGLARRAQIAAWPVLAWCQRRSWQRHGSGWLRLPAAGRWQIHAGE
jgi:hypothetical protein